MSLDPSKIEINYSETKNIQYLYDSHLYPMYFENELLFEYGENQAQYFSTFYSVLNSLMDEHNIDSKIATHLGCSTGRTTFELTKRFNKV